MTASLLETCNKVWLYLRRSGPLTTDGLCEEMGMSTRECELALSWLANRNMIAIVEEHGQIFWCWTDSEQGFGG